MRGTSEDLGMFVPSELRIRNARYICFVQFARLSLMRYLRLPSGCGTSSGREEHPNTPFVLPKLKWCRPVGSNLCNLLNLRILLWFPRERRFNRALQCLDGEGGR